MILSFCHSFRNARICDHLLIQGRPSPKAQDAGPPVWFGEIFIAGTFSFVKFHSPRVRARGLFIGIFIAILTISPCFV